MGAAWQGSRGAIAGGDTPAEPALRPEGLVGGRSDRVEHVAQQVWSDLVSRRTERGRGYRLVGWQLQAVAACLIPEALEQVLVPTTIAVGDHVEQESGQQLGSERPVAGEVAWIAAEAGIDRGREKPCNEVEDLGTMYLDVTGICSRRLRSLLSFFLQVL